MNIKNVLPIGNISGKFSVEKTKKFQFDMDNALKAMDQCEVIKVLITYDIILYKESKEFLTGYTEMMDGWQKECEGTVLVDKVKTSKSLCIACQHGKNITVYEFHYKHSGLPEPDNGIIYKNEFGMLYDIRDGILHDLAICNAFLNKVEMGQLRE